jgi:putative transposase
VVRHGRPEIFNTDQGSQFTTPRFTAVLTEAGVKVSMDGKGRWMDNVFIERLWRDQRQPSCPTPTAMLAAVSSRRSGVAWP